MSKTPYSTSSKILTDTGGERTEEARICQSYYYNGSKAKMSYLENIKNEHTV